MSDELFKQENYSQPKEEFIQFSPEQDGTIKETEIKEKEDAAPDLLTAPKMDILRYAAKKGMQADLVDPDPSCKKCYGLGYVGVNTLTHMPSACKCIFPTPVNMRRIEKQKARLERLAKGSVNV